jgi:glycosyl transferase family 29 (putative sialyltransferase)
VVTILLRLKRAIGRPYRHGIEVAYAVRDFFRAPRPPGSRSDREYADFLRRKRVVLVGPAQTVMGTGQGASIDAHDVVIRLNHALPIPKAMQGDLGGRTDILYHNLDFTGPNKLPLRDFLASAPSLTRWICSAHPYLRWVDGKIPGIDTFVSALGERSLFRTVNPRGYLLLWHSLRSLPNAGVSAIQDLRRFDLSELYLTGFTFYSGPVAYYPGYRGQGHLPQWHDQTSQLAIVRRWVARDKRIRCDAPLHKILFGAATAQGGIAH